MKDNMTNGQKEFRITAAPVHALRLRLQRFVGATIFQRGVVYAERRSVVSCRAFIAQEDLGAREIEFRGQVDGSQQYTSAITLDIASLQWRNVRCTCPYDDACKHAVALGITALECIEQFLGSQEPTDVEGLALDRETFTAWCNATTLGKAYDAAGDDELADAESGELLRARGDDEEDEDDEDARPRGPFDAVFRLRSPPNRPAVRPRVIRRPPIVTFASCTVVLRRPSYANALRVELWRRGRSVVSHDIFRRAADATPAREALVRTITRAGTWGNTGDPLILLQTIRDAGLPMAWEDVGRPIVFDDHPERLRVHVVRRPIERNSYLRPGALQYQNPRITCTLAGATGAAIWIPTSEGILRIGNGVIAHHALPKSIIDLIERAVRERYYDPFVGHSDPLGTAALTDRECIALPSLLDAFRAHVDLQSELPEPITIVASNEKPAPCVIVDYRASHTALDVSVAMDYGIARINLAESVQISRSYGRPVAQRWYPGQDTAIITLSGRTLTHAKIRKGIETTTALGIWERAAWLGFTKQLRCERKGKDACWTFVRKFLPRLQELGWPIVFPHDRLEVVRGAFSAHFDVAANAKQDWLAFDVDAFHGEDRVTIAQLRAYKKDRDGTVYVPLADGRWWKVENVAEFNRFIALLESFDEREGAKQFEGRLWNAPELDAMAQQSAYYRAKMDADFTAFMAEAKRGKPVTRVELPDAVHRTLRSYQRSGVDWLHFLRQYRFGGVLADDMGTGKTLQALTMIHRHREPGTPSLVVCPKSLLRNWEQEAMRFFPDLRVCVLDGMAAERRALLERVGDYDLAITSYATLQRDAEVLRAIQRRWHYCILDEAQAIKNPRTKNAHTVKGVDAAYRLALTGTPLENSVTEVWSIFDFLMPGFLGKYDRFVEHFERPIMERGDDRALAALREKTRCFMLRRTKGEVLTELPPKVEQRVTCDLTNTQRILYEEIRARAKKDIVDTVATRGFAKSHIHIFAALTKLRQACDHPALLVKDIARYRNESGKLDGFRELVSEVAHAKRKVLVFSQFTQMLDLLKLELQEMGIPYVELTGKTEHRQDLVDRFNSDPALTVFLISLKAGGVGLNLASADTVILYDPWWNPAVEQQAIDRTHRIGQTRSVNVYRLITRGTIEEKILKLQERKQRLFDSLIAQTGDLFQKLTWEDVQELFE